jgi:hypothetical protein
LQSRSGPGPGQATKYPSLFLHIPTQELTAEHWRLELIKLTNPVLDGIDHPDPRPSTLDP